MRMFISRLRYPFIIALSFLSLTAYSQESPAYLTLKKYYLSLPVSVADSNWLMTPIDSSGMNYLLPLRQGLQREKYRAIIDTAAYYDLMSDALCRLTDYASSQWYEKKLLGTLTREEQDIIKKQAQPLLQSKSEDARAFTLRLTGSTQVSIFNASYLKPYTYVWLAGMLDTLYRQGYRHLALELLSPVKAPLQEISVAEGLFTAEPVMAEFIRMAIASGFSVISCQPDYALRNEHERKKEQAMRLGSYFKQLPFKEKLLVITQPELFNSAEGSQTKPFSLYLSSWLGETCVSIDQCTLSPNSIDAAGAWLYDWLEYQKPIIEPIVPVVKDQPVLWNDPYYSAMVRHPAPIYNSQRPTWMGFNGRKRPIALPAAHPKSWLVQAFYLEELKKRKPGNCIPADQTYQLASDGNYYLYLQPGPYRIIFRSKDNTILTYRDIEVNK